MGTILLIVGSALLVLAVVIGIVFKIHPLTYEYRPTFHVDKVTTKAKIDSDDSKTISSITKL
ncbi:MAG: hypothetical protein HUJ56_01080 [Erysipelotrichaceae bacterium]|nr:hypothetical protein [Erysipelotrichaceae bacterium]